MGVNREGGREGGRRAVVLDLSKMLSYRRQHDDATRALVSLMLPLVLCLSVLVCRRVGLVLTDVTVVVTGDLLVSCQPVFVRQLENEASGS